MFDGAHEVELIDLPPDDLIERLREGKVYVAGQAARAIDNYFKKGNLFALRELALRRTAERVGAQVQGYRQAHAISDTWQTSERVLHEAGCSHQFTRTWCPTGTVELDQLSFEVMRTGRAGIGEGLEQASNTSPKRERVNCFEMTAVAARDEVREIHSPARSVTMKV